MRPYHRHCLRHDDRIQHEVNRDNDDGYADDLAEATHEHGAKDEQQAKRDEDGMVHPARDQRVFNEMGRGVGRRQRDRDDEARRRESEQDEDDSLPLPAGEQRLQHQNAALSVRARLRDAVVHRQRPDQREQDEHERRERGEQSGGREGDARLICERREVIDAGEAHDFPPRRLVRRGRVRPLGNLTHALKEPVAKGHCGSRRSNL